MEELTVFAKQPEDIVSSLMHVQKCVSVDVLAANACKIVGDNVMYALYVVNRLRPTRASVIKQVLITAICARNYNIANALIAKYSIEAQDIVYKYLFDLAGSSSLNLHVFSWVCRRCNVTTTMLRWKKCSILFNLCRNKSKESTRVLDMLHFVYKLDRCDYMMCDNLMLVYACEIGNVDVVRWLIDTAKVLFTSEERERKNAVVVDMPFARACASLQSEIVEIIARAMNINLDYLRVCRYEHLQNACKKLTMLDFARWFVRFFGVPREELVELLQKTVLDTLYS